MTPRIRVALVSAGLSVFVVAAGPAPAAAQDQPASSAVVAGRSEAPSTSPLAPADVPESGREADAAVAKSDAAAQQTPQTQIDELRRRIEVLAEEVERLRSGEADQVELTADEQRALGLAPSASATYRRTQGISFAGYGEMLYENFAGENESGRPVFGGSQLDFLRLILYSGYRFSDKFIFNSEIELEHSNEISVEFAYVDYLARDTLTLRAGMLLLPLGLTNEFHEPTVFLGARRPETETRIIPTTWRENGAGMLGSAGRVNYRAYVVNGLDATRFAAGGLRGGRQKGARAKASDLAFAGRLDVTPTAGVFVGGGLYTGGSGQGVRGVDGRELDVRTTIGEVHGQAQVRGVDVRGLYARAQVDEAAELSRTLGLTGDDGIGETMGGGYLQVGYNVLSQRTSRGAVTPYYRFEKVNTQRSVPSGFAIDPATEATFHTLGVEFKPIFNIVIKADHQWTTNEAGTGRNQFNVGLGYAF